MKSEAGSLHGSRKSEAGSLHGAMKSEAGSLLQGYPKIRKSMEEYVLYGNKPRIMLKSRGDRPTFFNTLEAKYGVSWRGERSVFNYDRQGHRSSRHELTFIASQRLRKDW